MPAGIRDGTGEATALTAILDTNDDDRIVDANDAFVELVGPARDEVIGAPITAFLAPDLRGHGLPEHETDWHGRRADGLPWCATLSTFRSDVVPGGSVLHGIRRFGPVRWLRDGATDEPPRSAGIDSVISHDLRGALRGASGFVSVVKRTADDAEISRLHERLAKAGEHLAIAARSLATADEIADKVVHHLRWGARPLAMRTIPLEDVVEQAAILSEDSYDGPLAEIDVADLPVVVADVDHVRWAIAELITNARKFSADEPSLSIELVDDADGFCNVALHDNGIGIDPLLVEDAFLPGRKLQARGDYPGVGMGLALCRLVFERHAGACRADARMTSAAGTTILFRLPSSSPS